MKATLTKLKIEATRDFCNHSKSEEKKYRWNWHKSGPPGDALILEHYLIENNYVTEPLNWRHDFIYRNNMIDAKEIMGLNFNIHNGKVAQYIESIKMKQLTHFLFWSSDRPRDRYIEEGEIINLKIEGFVSSRSVLKSRLDSHYGDTEAYVPLGIIRDMNEKFIIGD